MPHQSRRRRALLDDCSARREIAAQHAQAAVRVDRVCRRADHRLAGNRFGRLRGIAQACAAHRAGLEIDETGKFGQQPWHPAGVMEMLHVGFARGFEVDEHRHRASDLIDRLEVDRLSQSPGNRGKMNETVGGAADRLQHHERVAKCGGVENLAGARTPAGHPGGATAGRLGAAQAFRMGRGNRRAAGKRQPERLDEAGHGAGRAHHHAGAD